ncbi:serine/threonine-protein phosphatase [Curvibacter sp. CHRR-16]|uniref:PP2C family protein-serine/threonine phosphatase n=1 Tax=Curvibacter sp. CHRR-16 TaxID=2835872 RepID=UPI001BDA2479|nr:protein phosphatase 2C domain-containing protein [Curvibacter sp. CHRR-16]MBT0570644.1 serine/threonine-protein phosphatase [Curvibacter sp. CHRR-16]
MSTGFRISASTGIHKGDREYQQDQVALLKHARVNGCLMAVVADGMGGRSGGRKASDQVMLTAKQLFDSYAPETDDPQGLLKQIVNEAHMVIRLTAISAEEEPHSTIATILIHPEGDCYWAHAGDSRIYHFRGKKLVKRTLDHSYVQTLVNKGELTEEQAMVHPQSNILLSCLGTESEPPVETHTISQLKPGDALMVCSDGVWHYFNNAELGTVIAELTPREATEFLIAKARTRAQGGGDNLSVAIIKVEHLTKS